MLKKLAESLQSRRKAIDPKQGNRLKRSDTPEEGMIFSIRGTRFPGFFIFFGLIFGGIPTFILLGILFGTPDPDSETGAQILSSLFLLPFILVGVSTFSVGVFISLGKTLIIIGPRQVSIRRELFGKTFQTKHFQRPSLHLSFKESHETNGRPSYKLNFEDENTKGKIGIGGSLKEAELLWLEREIKKTLGQGGEEHRGVLDAISKEQSVDFSKVQLDPNYHSKTLTFTKTASGWKARSRTTLFSALSAALFGAVFFLAGLSMYEPSRNWLIDQVPGLHEIFSPEDNSSEEPLLWFPLIFGGVGVIFILSGLFLLNYRSTISKQHARLHRERRWFIFVNSQVFELAALVGLTTKQSGKVNETPRHSLSARFKSGKTVKLINYASAEDTGQIYARLREHLPEGEGLNLPR